MREIEVKIGIGDINQIIKMLEEKGCVMSEPLVQEDVIFIPKDENKLPVPAGVSVLRVRTQNGKSEFALKQSDPGKHLHLSKLEIETGIDNPEQMKKAILALGFQHISTVKKVRRKCKLGNIEICVDQVENLGSFLEAEKITDEDPQNVQQELLDLLQSLGVDVSKRVFVGYDVLMYQQYGTARI